MTTNSTEFTRIVCGCGFSYEGEAFYATDAYNDHDCPNVPPQHVLAQIAGHVFSGTTATIVTFLALAAIMIWGK